MYPKRRLENTVHLIINKATLNCSISKKEFQVPNWLYRTLQTFYPTFQYLPKPRRFFKDVSSVASSLQHCLLSGYNATCLLPGSYPDNPLVTVQAVSSSLLQLFSLKWNVTFNFRFFKFVKSKVRLIVYNFLLIRYND